MKIGKYTLKIIESGFFGLDGGSMFGVVPKPLWEITNPPDKSNRIKLATRHLILEGDSKKIIIDTGVGTKFGEKLNEIYAVDNNFSMETALSQAGLKPEDITDVVLTHLHFDHAGGATKIENGKPVPAFPNARYYVQKQNYDWAVNPSERDKASYLLENYVPLFEAGVINFTIGDAKLDDEIDFIVINGHTFGQQMVKIFDSSSTFLFCSDLIPTASHIPLPYIMGYDLQPLVTLKEKKKILKQATHENWFLFFGHDPEIAFANLKHTEKGIRINESFTEFNDD